MVRTALIFLVAGVLGLAPVQAAQTAAAQPKSYAWHGELVTLDDASRTATIKAPIREHVGRYVNRFKPGDSLILLWDMGGKAPRADHVQALWEYDAKAAAQPVGYVLPIKFVSADVPSLTLTFSTQVPATELAKLKSAGPGQMVEVTAPIDPLSH